MRPNASAQRFMRRRHARDPHRQVSRPSVHRVQIRRESSDRQPWRRVYVARAFGRRAGLQKVWTVIRDTIDEARSALRVLLQQLRAQLDPQPREVLQLER